MPKRGNEDSLEVIAKKLRKLEKVVNRSRRGRQSDFRLSSSSSSSSSRSSTSCSSRESTPSPRENQSNKETIVAEPSQFVDSIEVEPTPIENSKANQAAVSNTADQLNPPVGDEQIDTNTEILDILGEDPSVTIEYGLDINKEVATRFTHIVTSGMNKDVRKELIKKYLVPANCTSIAAPQLNAEIKAALPDTVLKRDKAIETRQKQISAGISSLGSIISNQLNSKEKNNDLIKDLMDVSRIFCDLQHTESEARRNFALYSVKKDLKDQLSTTKIDKYLFGSNLSEAIKTAKAVTKSSSDLKVDPPKKPKGPVASTSKNLNWKRTPARRQPTGPSPRFQAPAMQNVPPRKTSSQPYTQRPKQNHRR